MNRLSSTILVGGAALLVFDTVGAIACKRLRLEYHRLAPVSFVIDFAVGFLFALHGPVTLAMIASGAVALIESTLGWAIAAAVGPGRLPADKSTPLRIVVTIALVTAAGSVLGMLGAAWSHWLF